MSPDIHQRPQAREIVRAICKAGNGLQQHLQLIEQGAPRMGQLVDELLKLAAWGGKR